jgi:hypothetical protein
MPSAVNSAIAASSRGKLLNVGRVPNMGCEDISLRKYCSLWVERSSIRSHVTVVKVKFFTRSQHVLYLL